MNFTVNNREFNFDKEMSISDFLKIRKLNGNTVVVEVNNKIVQREEFDSFTIKDDDHLEVLSFVGGG